MPYVPSSTGATYIILDIGLIHTKIGNNVNKTPFKITNSPWNIILNEDFLKDDYFQLYKPFTEEF